MSAASWATCRRVADRGDEEDRFARRDELESSIEYDRSVNEEVRDRLGGLHSADCLLRAVDFTEIEAM